MKESKFLKGDRLPRAFKKRGYSMFFFIRLLQEGITPDIWGGGSHDSAINKLYRKYGLIK